jgi:CHAD domain-containing protein
MSETQVGDVVTRAIADGVARLLRNDAALRGGAGESEGGRENEAEGEGDAIETVHQMRVATRRLRSDLRTFRTALDSRWAASLRAELGWLAGLLGTARDADVLWQRLTDRSQELAPESARGADHARAALAPGDGQGAAHVRTALPPGDGQGAAAVLAALADQRASARAVLLTALESDRHRALLDRLTEAAQAPALRTSKAAQPAAQALPLLVLAAWRALEKKVDSCAEHPSDDELHGVRISAKRCRYAAEACAPWLGKPTARLARAAKGLQDVLGELNDAVVAERWLREWAAGAGSSSGANAAAELAALEHAAARRARSRWPKAWRGVTAAAPTKG